jgi:cobyrinic acid a,c-diamide synthase
VVTVRVPRLVIAAPASGSGKTTVATGLMAALTAQGLVVSPHKVGPDYIDPGYHTLAAGRPGRNLDPWLTSEDLIEPLFLHGAGNADIAVIEGVMGLFDGAAPSHNPASHDPASHNPPSARESQSPPAPHSPPARGADPTSIVQREQDLRAAERGSGDNFNAHHIDGFASTAHVATLLNAPVVLVIDAASTGRSIAAVAHGFVTFDPRVRIAGVILNKVGSDRHEQICRAAMEEVGLPVLGVLRRQDEVATPSRHLGLIPAAERHPEALKTVDRLSDLITRNCDLKALVALAHTAAPLTAEPWAPTTKTMNNTRIAIAGGPAFTFGYAENDELLRAAGAELVRFDPLRDTTLPEATKGIVIGGGFPETYAAELSANERLRRHIATFQGPIYAECAGLLYLTRRLDDNEMCGVIDAEAAMTERLTLGYRAAVAVADSPVTRTGERVRGHEFHRTAIKSANPSPAWQWHSTRTQSDGFATPNCLASYLHLHWAGTPQLATRFVGACA